LGASLGTSSLNGIIALPKVDEDIGHTLIHYLHALVYQTLKTNGPSPKIEYRRRVLVYSTAVKYQIEGLATVAKQEMEKYDGVVTVLDRGCLGTLSSKRTLHVYWTTKASDGAYGANIPRLRHGRRAICQARARFGVSKQNLDTRRPTKTSKPSQP
jgi:hypothetical protein